MSKGSEAEGKLMRRKNGARRFPKQICIGLLFVSPAFPHLVVNRCGLHPLTSLWETLPGAEMDR